MRYRSFLERRLVDVVSTNEKLPSGYHLVGYVALVEVRKELLRYAREIGEATLEYDKRIESVAIRTGPTTGVTRRPNYIVVAGNRNTVVTHVEGRAKYRLDPLILTFSGGNKRERIRMGTIVRPGETVFDMFACVGQFSIPIAMNNARRVYAAEINPTAYDYLLENIKLNKVEQRMKPFLGDCREYYPDEKVDRVIMGYLHDTHQYLNHAISVLNEDGGVVHMHIALQDDDRENIAMYVEELCSGYDLIPSISVRTIKDYAPNVKHYVFDVSVSSKHEV